MYGWLLRSGWLAGSLGVVSLIHLIRQAQPEHVKTDYHTSPFVHFKSLFFIVLLLVSGIFLDMDFYRLV